MVPHTRPCSTRATLQISVVSGVRYTHTHGAKTSRGYVDQDKEDLSLSMKRQRREYTTGM